jgi:hypothetical protein
LFLQIGRMEEYAFFEVPIWPRDGKNNL